MTIKIPIVSQFSDKGVKQAESSFKSLKISSDMVTKSLKAGALAAAAGIATAAYAAYDFAKAAIEDEAAAAELARSLKATTGATNEQIASVEKWITATSLATGTADSELRPALAAISRSTKDVTKAQKLLATAQNISAATNKPLALTAKAVSQAYNGQFGALKKLSPELAALIKSGATADEVFASLDKTFANASETAANTAAGKFKRFQVAVSELKEGIGVLLLPVLGKVANFLTTKVIPAFEKFQEQVGKDGFVKTVSDYVKKGFDWLINDGISLAAKKAVAFGKAVIDYMSPRWKPLGEALLKLLKRFSKWVTETAYPWLGREIPKAMKAFTDWFDDNSDALVKGTAKLITALALWIATEGTPAMAKLGAALLLAMFSFNASMTATIMKQLITSIGDIVGKIATEGTKIGNALGKGIVNALISQLNIAIDAMNALIRGAVGVSKYLGPVGAAIGGAGKNFQIDHIPALAEGGIINKPGGILALVGEAGPEAVIPLDRMGDMGGGVNITIQTGVGDPIAIGREIERIMQRYQRRTGVAA
jgi:hypothetical protein